MNSLDIQYIDLLDDILTNGTSKEDRTGTGTLSVFGRQIRHNMREGFPLLTTKKMAWKTMTKELLWFLSGDTNIKWLVENKCNIWNGDAYKAYADVECNPPHDHSLSKSEFIEKIKTDNEFADKWGYLGRIYGAQWREWIGFEQFTNHAETIYVDQIENLINDLKTNPDSRRLLVSAWNPAELDRMTLPPCHYGFQCYVRDGKYLSLMWNQRSVDTFLGLPFNIASYGMLLLMLAKECDLIPDQLIGNLGDVHLYKNHVEQAIEQTKREPYPLPDMKLTSNHNFRAAMKGNMDEIDMDDFILLGYQSHPSIKAPLSN